MTYNVFGGPLNLAQSLMMRTDPELIIFLSKPNRKLNQTKKIKTTQGCCFIHAVPCCNVGNVYGLRQLEVDGLIHYSLDGGTTKFMDLIQLVDFYQLNAGALPTQLNYCVTRLL